jgi:hypothetical protein
MKQLAWFAILFWLVACETSAPRSSGAGATPTVGNLFSGATTATLQAAPPDQAQPATLAPLFQTTGTRATTGQSERAGTPTLGALFVEVDPTRAGSTPDRSRAPTLSPLMQVITTTPIAMGTRAPTATTSARPIAPSVPRANIIELTVYDEELAPNWTLDNSKDVKFDLKHAGQIKNGKVALSATPQTEFAMLMFAVRADAQENFPRERVWGVSLWLTGGENEIGPEDFALTVIGSNDFKHWVADDQSVKVDQKTFFSETRLYYLGITRAVPRNTWVELIVQLGKLPYDPDYKFVTGIYLKNDKTFVKPYFVDRVNLLMLK